MIGIHEHRGGTTAMAQEPEPRTLQPQGQDVRRKDRIARGFLPHQTAAIRAATSHYRREDRGLLVSPCGTGKTATAAGIREELGSRNTLVLLPSLVLVRQFQEEWASWRATPYEAMCVCSDDDAMGDEDAVPVGAADLGGEVSTIPSVIARFLGRPAPKVIFATYHSLDAVCLAASEARVSFDLSVCDEAHRTAGHAMKLFGRIHDDGGVRVRKRLYMTATPRVAATIAGGQTAPGRLYDMDDPAVFGHPFFRMTFKEAIERRLLAACSILAIGIDDLEVRRWMRESAQCGDCGPIEDVARNFALDLVMRKYGARRAISYHARVRAAADFSERHRRLFGDVVSAHVSGRQSPATRRANLGRFAAAPVATVSNARCLVEGFDLPAVHMVFFCDPKRSTVDIVQAAGRALRLDASRPDKRGLIVLPVFHGSNGELDDDLAGSGFRQAAHVLRAMSDDDGVLLGEISWRHIGGISRMQPAATPAAIDAARFVVTGFGGRLEKALFDQVVGKPSREPDPWPAAHRALLRFRETNPGRWPARGEACPEGIDLWKWCRAQRRAHGRGTLPEARLRLLDECGLLAEAHPCWLVQYQRLRSWLALRPREWPALRTEHPAGNRLGAWCGAQRRARRKGALSADRVSLLDKLGFPWGRVAADTAGAVTGSRDQSQGDVTVVV